MASTLELLDAIDAQVEEDICIVDAVNRTISVPESLRLLGVESDEKAEIRRFRCPKIVGNNIDLTALILFINFENAGGQKGAYRIKDVQEEGDGTNITFSWELERKVTAFQGVPKFSLCAQRVKSGDDGTLEQEWNTTFNEECEVLEGLEVQGSIEEEETAALTQIWQKIDELELAISGGGSGTTNYNNLSNKPQLNGVTLEGNKTLDQVGVLAKNQGASNSGKYLSVGSDGNVVPADAPSGGTVDSEQIEQAVNSYLEKNPVQPTPIDKTLTVENEAADAKVTGEKIENIDVNNKIMNISIGGSNTLVEILKRICEKLEIKYGLKLYSNYLGFVSPMDGAYSDWVYNNMYSIGDKIYFSYMIPQTHWNQKKDARSRMCVYDTKTKSYEYWERICEGEGFAASATIYDQEEDAFYSFNSQFRFKSIDKGKTWTKQAITGMPNSPHYLTRLSNGRLIVAPDSTTLYKIAISDDKGLTWEVFNPFSSNYCVTHCRFYEVENGKIVAYFFNPFVNNARVDRSSESFRWYSVSDDYGETWTEPKHCEGELEKAGVSYMTGAIVYYGNLYHYITAERLPETDKPDKIGRIRWFSGSKEELLTGNLKLVEEIDSVVAKSLNGNNGWNSTSISDSGNIGACIGSDGIYVIYGSILDQFGNGFICSNQGLKMFRLGAEDIGDAVDEYYDETQKERLDEMYSEKLKSYNYYIYDNQTTNIEGIELFGIDGSYAIPKSAKKIIPVGEKDFELNAIFRFKNMMIDNQLWSVYAPYMPIGFQTSEGELHGYVGKAVNQYGLNAGSTDTSNNPFMLACGNGTAYITIKRKNKHLFLTLNGATIKDPVYDNYAFKEYYKLPDVMEDSLVWNYEPGSDDGTFVNFLDKNSESWNKNNLIAGFKMLTITVSST